MSTDRRRSGDDQGSVTLFFVIVVVGLMVLAGLVIDGGAKVRAIQHADRLAAEAARAAGQAIDIPAAIEGDAPRVDPAAAVAAAQTYLAAAGVTGTTTVTDGGRGLHVEITTIGHTVFLGLIGINTLTVHGGATVSLVRGVSGARP